MERPSSRMPIEIKVRISDSEKHLVKLFLVYEPVTFQDDSPTLNRYIEESLKEFKGTPEKVTITAKSRWN